MPLQEEKIRTQTGTEERLGGDTGKDGRLQSEQRGLRMKATLTTPSS